MVVRSTKKRVLAEWYAIWHRSGKRLSAKIGTYPTVGVAEARRIFRELYFPVILKGEDPVGPRATNARGKGTAKELFEAYVTHLGDRPQAKGARQILLGKNGAANAIGPNRPAAAVRKQHMIPHLAAIHDRGSVTQANNVRNILHAAFAYGIRSASSFYDRASATDWGLEFNPVSAISQNPDAGTPRERFLTEAEFATFWRWLVSHRGRNPAIDALRLMMATGQRPCEILALTVDHYDRENGLLYWKKTKNGRPHCIPLPQQAAAILDALSVNGDGRYFPARKGCGSKAGTSAASRLVRRYIRETGAAHFEARDLRRTWKTLSGAAGIAKDIRDRMQNHAISDVSSRHYDRWDYLPEKRQAMVTWETHLDKILTRPFVAEPWPAPDVLESLENAMSSQCWRGTPQAHHHPDWIGYPVAQAFAVSQVGEWRSETWLLVRRLARCGALSRRMVKDHKHREVPVFVFSGRESDDSSTGALAKPVRLQSQASLDVEVSATLLSNLQRTLGDRRWRSAPQARRQPDWVGFPIADALALPRTGDWKTKVSRISFSLSEQGILVRETVRNEVGFDVPFVRLRDLDEAADDPFWSDNQTSTLADITVAFSASTSPTEHQNGGYSH